jgi:hypothetical protein
VECAGGKGVEWRIDVTHPLIPLGISKMRVFLLYAIIDLQAKTEYYINWISVVSTYHVKPLYRP